MYYIGFLGSAPELRRDPAQHFDVPAANAATDLVGSVGQSVATPSVR